MTQRSSENQLTSLFEGYFIWFSVGPAFGSTWGEGCCDPARIRYDDDDDDFFLTKLKAGCTKCWFFFLRRTKCWLHHHQTLIPLSVTGDWANSPEEA
jgi:hypothetical protein